MTREVRQNFFEDLAATGSPRPGMLYSSGSDRKPDGGRVNSATIILSLDWPSKAQLGETFEGLRDSPQKAAIAAAVFRVKDFLERQLLAKIDVLDIRPGCIRVRYKLPERVEMEAVQSALVNLGNNRTGFDVSSVAGHVDGRSVKV